MVAAAAYKIFMTVIIILFTLGVLGEKDVKQQQLFAAILIAAIISLALAMIFI